MKKLLTADGRRLTQIHLADNRMNFDNTMNIGVYLR
jgi:hypothetical protein